MSALIVGVILAVGSIACFWIMRNELRGQVDESLRAQAQLVRAAPLNGLNQGRGLPRRIPQPPKRSGGAAPFVQFVSVSGRATRLDRTDPRLPIDTQDLAVARGDRSQTLRDIHTQDLHLRVMTVSTRNDGAVQLGRSLASVDHALSRLRLALATLVIGGVVLAVLLSRLFSRRAIAPIRSLTDATEHIESTGDLTRRVETDRDDEVGRLAFRFNAMLERLQMTQAALETSTAVQRQLVADASHELRTPVTGLRMNIEVLMANREIGDGDRTALLADLNEQAEELSGVVSDLIELARGDQPADYFEELDLGAIAAESLVRARRHRPDLEFRSQIEPSWLLGSPERLGRAINNLLDNAAKFSPEGATVELSVGNGQLSVRDQGPGVPDEDMPHIFDRFFRARNAGQLSGSGLGLAIVKQTVDAHGGVVEALPSGDGGLLIRARFPTADPDGDGARAKETLES
ncbi:MAG: ATP-binding protein [Aeromicrobium sp.]